MSNPALETADRAPPPRPGLMLLASALGVMLLIMIIVGYWIAQRTSAEFAKKAPVEKPQPTEPTPGAEPGAEKDKKAEGAGPSWGEYVHAWLTQPLFLWALTNSLMLALGCLVIGAASRPDDGAAARPDPPLRIVIAGIGGLLGFTTSTFLGVGFAVKYWIADPGGNMLAGLSTGGLAAWKELWPWLIVAATFGGLFLTFASLLAVRSEERKSPLLRRLLYGFNAFLVGFLLLSVLAVANGMFLIYGSNKAIDWTQSQIATLSPASKKALAAIEKPVQVYVLLARIRTFEDDNFRRELELLLKNAKGASPKFDWRILVASAPDDIDKINDLRKKYDLLGQEGMLVVYDPAGENSHLFIKRTASGPDDLGLEEFLPGMMRGAPERSSFRGEQALMSALRELSSGKARPVIYFTQDSGEMSLTDAAAAAGQRDRRGLGVLKTKLERAGYRALPWQLGAVDPNTRQQKPLPEDAAIVVVAAPSPGIETKLPALEAYMARPDSRLLLFFEPVRDREGRVQPTGFEAFLKKYGVEVGQDIVIHIPTQMVPQYTNVMVLPTVTRDAQSSMDSRLLEAFANQRFLAPMTLGEFRSFRIVPVTGFEPRALLSTFYLLDQQEGITGQWPETTPMPSVEAFIENLAKTNPQELQRKLQTPPVPVAVTVTDPSRPAGPPPHPGMPPEMKPGKPRLVAFGGITPLLNPDRNQLGFFLVTSALSWLRDKDVAIDTSVQAKPRHFYTPRVAPGEENALRFLPLVYLLLLTIFAGLTVALLRKR